MRALAGHKGGRMNVKLISDADGIAVYAVAVNDKREKDADEWWRLTNEARAAAAAAWRAKNGEAYSGLARAAQCADAFAVAVFAGGSSFSAIAWDGGGWRWRIDGERSIDGDFGAAVSAAAERALERAAAAIEEEREREKAAAKAAKAAAELAAFFSDAADN